MKKVLIIKLGYSETLDSALGLTTSLGDVLRTTVILHFFKGDEVTWLVDEKASPLLEHNPYIYRILTYTAAAVSQLRKETFDIVVNLEKLPEVCLLADSISAGERLGFRSNGSGNAKNHYTASSRKLEALLQDENKKGENRDCWQVILAETIGREWKGEGYVLGYRPNSEVRYDIGFNWTTGSKWTNKSWPRSSWEALEGLLGSRYTLSWQEGLDSLYEYIDWINSCRLIVTADSLGLHLALALKKRVVALFGPTSHHEIWFYDLGSFLLPRAPYGCVPCFRPHCDKERQCMAYISPERVRDKINDEFNKIAITA